MTYVPQPDSVPEPNRTDFVIALIVGICALAAYVRTLAPDMLYGDSAEFQTLAYTLGMTHSTGYPIYLLLGRLFGYLPVGSFAWRVNLLSALGAAGTLSGVFLLIRCLTRSRIGALLGSIALGLSYTFWSQAILAEVYTPAMAFLTAIVLLLWRWYRRPPHNNRLLLLAALLAGLGLGVHFFVLLIAPPAIIFVIWTLCSRRGAKPNWRRILAAALTGLALGAGIFLATFLLIDANNPPTSFVRVALYPSRSIWGLTAADLDTPFERLAVTVSARQWQDAMFPGDIASLWGGFKNHGGRLVTDEFSPATILSALLGLAVMLRTAPRLGSFVLVGLITTLFFVLNYDPPDRYIFYLPTYAFIAIAAGTGTGFLLELVHRYLVASRRRRYLVLYPFAAALLVLAVAGPFRASRWQALQAGAATFVREQYAYPLHNLDEPRQVATQRLAYLPEDALLVLDWQALYATYYLAHVEQGRTDRTIMEASPHGGEGRLADTLVQELTDALLDRRPIYADRVFTNLRSRFRAQPVQGTDLYRLSLPETIQDRQDFITRR
jgi:4-amino-4-deoxy-L-arabinose transferase-like glycosyltransferase